MVLSREVEKKAGAALMMTGAILGLGLSGCIAPEDVNTETAISHGGIVYNTWSDSTVDCWVEAHDNYYGLRAESLSLKGKVRLHEDPTGMTRWSGGIEVQWHQWPTKDGLLEEPQGASPGDQQDRSDWSPTVNQKNSVTDELKLSWDHEDFEVEGKYKATLTLSLTKEGASEDGDWKTLCHRTQEATVTVDWRDKEE